MRGTELTEAIGNVVSIDASIGRSYETGASTNDHYGINAEVTADVTTAPTNNGPSSMA